MVASRHVLVFGTSELEIPSPAIIEQRWPTVNLSTVWHHQNRRTSRAAHDPFFAVAADPRWTRIAWSVNTVWAIVVARLGMWHSMQPFMG